MTTNLPDNVSAVTRYTIDQGDNASEVTVELNGESLWLRQDDDTVLVRVYSVPGLIAALQDAAGIPTAEDPAYVIDGDGDRWHRESDGTCTLGGHENCECEPSHHHRTIADILARYGIAETA